MKRGLAADLGSAAALAGAIGDLRAHGMTRLEAFTPVPSDEVDAAIGGKRSPLPKAAALGGLAGAIGGYALEWLLTAYLYPIDSGGRPAHMPLAYLIIAIEMGFLLGALATVAAFTLAARLGTLWAPVDEVPGFAGDGCWLAVDAEDPAFDRAQIEAALRERGAPHVYRFGGLA
ncbi:MAG TPA: DUF3341 domain-containing protein [Kofleriaceae bacterium]|jgi:hypothetical protein